MNFDLLLSIIKERRSVRKYSEKPVSDEQIEKILKAARWAPCGANLQPWEIIVVKDIEKRKIIRENIYRLQRNGGGPIYFIVCGDNRMKEYYPPRHTDKTREYTLTVSIAAAIQNMLLAATALGLGSLWRTVFQNQASALEKLLGLPEFIRIMSVIEVGHYTDKPDPPPKRNIEEFTHVNFYDKEKIVDAKEAWLVRSIHSPRRR